MVYVRSKVLTPKTEAVKLGLVEAKDDMDRVEYFNTKTHCVVLYKKFDGGPDVMKEFFRAFAENIKSSFPEELAMPTTEWLTYPEDMAAMMIYRDVEEWKKQAPGIQIRPDMRPPENFGYVVDAQHIYVVDLQNLNDVWNEDKTQRKYVGMTVRAYAMIPNEKSHEKTIRGYDLWSGAIIFAEQFDLYVPSKTDVPVGRAEVAVKLTAGTMERKEQLEKLLAGKT